MGVIVLYNIAYLNSLPFILLFVNTNSRSLLDTATRARCETGISIS